MAGGTIQMGGMASGMNTDRMVKKMVKAESHRLDDLRQSKSQAEETRKLYREFNKQLKGVLDAARGLDDANLFQARSVSSSDPKVATASADKQAELNSYSLSPKQLARSQTLLLGPGDDQADGQFGRRLDDPESAKQIGEGVELAFHHGGERYSYRTDGDTTLSSFATTIDEADNGVRAAAVNIGTPDRPQYVLQLKSETTGTGDRQISKDDVGDHPGVAISGGSLFTQSGRAGDEVQQSQPGRNARFVLDGVEYARPGNEVDDVIPGVSFTLEQGEGRTDIEVSRNTDNAAKAVKGLVDAYNQALGFIQSNASYNSDSEQGGALLGDTLPRTVEGRMSTLMGGEFGGAEGDAVTLFEAGIHFQRDGRLKFDKEEFVDALEGSPNKMQRLFAGEDGLAQRLESMMEGYTQAGSGLVPSKIDSLGRRAEGLGNDIQDEQSRLKRFEERQQERFAELERTMAGFNSKKKQMAQAMSKLPGA